MSDAVADSEAIAVIGMATRVPGADDVEQFWDNLARGRESITRLDEEFLLAHDVRPERLEDPNYVRAAALVDGVEDFDAEFFGLTPRDAAATDPQIRLFLEIAHSVLENAGYRPREEDQTVGIFASVGPSRYATMHLGENSELAGGSGLALHTLNHSDYLATTVSYRLDLRGPSMTVLSACSSSLVALHLACQSLRSGDCDAAIVGGASVEFPVGHGYLWSPGSVLSRDGHCRPFDAEANGTVFGSGAAAVLLKPLAEAIQAGDRVSAVILGSAVNNDGAHKVSFGAPCLTGQAAVVMEAMQLADVQPAEIGYVEMHGTGTPLGDPIELAALTEAYTALAASQPLPHDIGIGSVKGNLGHLGPVAGVIGLIKAVLALEREQLPPTINLSTPNPQLGLDRTPFAPVRQLRAWPASPDSRRRAAVSSLGIGGTNVHVVLGEAPYPDAPFQPPGQQLIVWSARTEDAAATTGTRLAEWFTRTGDVQLAAAAATLQHGREQHAVRRAVVVADARDAAAAVTDPDRVRTSVSVRPVALPPLSELPTSALRAFAARVPAFEPVLLELLAAHDRGGTALAQWADGGVGGPVLRRAARIALAQLWLRHGAPIELLAPPADCPDLLDALDAPDAPSELADLLDAPSELAELPSADPGLAPPPEHPAADPLWDCHLEVLAAMWVSGTDVDWTELGCPPPRRRAALPPYPYRRVRHWVPPRVTPVPPAAATRPTGDGNRHDRDAALAAWTPVWQQSGSRLRTGAGGRAADLGRVLLLEPADRSAARSVELALRQLGADPVRADPESPAADGPDALIVDARGFGNARGLGVDPGLGAVAPSAGPLLILTSDAADVSGCEPVDPARAAFVARSLAAVPAGRWLDAPARTAPEQLAAALAGVLAPDADPLALRGARGWRPERCPIEAGWQNSRFAPDGRAGLLLVADEHGSVALELAEALASAGASTDLLVITGADAATRAALVGVEDSGPTVELLPWPSEESTLATVLAGAPGRRRVAGLVLAADSPERAASYLSAVRQLGTALPDRVVALCRLAGTPTAALAEASAAAINLADLDCDTAVTVLTAGGPVGELIVSALGGGCPPVVVTAR